MVKDFGVEGEWSFFLPTTQLLPSPPPIESKLHLKCWELGKGKSAFVRAKKEGRKERKFVRAKEREKEKERAKEQKQS